MKEWKDEKNRYELYLDGKEACVMYHDEAGYYVRAYLNGESQAASLDEGSLDAAKRAAENWYAEQLKYSIGLHERHIDAHKKALGALGG